MAADMDPLLVAETEDWTRELAEVVGAELTVVPLEPPELSEMVEGGSRVAVVTGE